MTTTLPQPKTRKPAAPAGPQKRVKPRADPRAEPRTRPAARPKARPSPGARPAARAPRTPFVLLVVGLLGGALISLLLLNTVLAEDAFRLNDLQRQNTALLQREQALKVDVKKAEAPGALAQRARRLGMRPGPMTPRFADAQDAKTVGAGSGPATAPRPTPHRTAAHRPRATKPARHRHHTAGRTANPAPSPSGGDRAFAGSGR